MSRTSIELLPTISITAPPPIILKAQSPKSPAPSHINLVAPEDGRNVSESLVRDEQEVSWAKSLLVIGTVSSMTLMGSLLTGILTVGLPTIARDVNLEESLLLW